jgi:subtilisin family serine protease
MRDLVNARQARAVGRVDGRGITVAVLDSGCFADHNAFRSSIVGGSRVLPGHNCTGVGNASNSTDVTGHGTAVAGIVAGRGIAPVIAPEANILPLKVIPEQGELRLDFIFDALSWLLDEGRNRGASVVCLSQGDAGNYRSVEQALAAGGPIRQQISEKIRELRTLHVPTVCAAGNSYYNGPPPGAASPSGRSEIGMCFPAILPECVSVGAVFTDSSMRNHTFVEYGNARVVESDSDRVTPFSQRLPKSSNSSCFTRLFAPGAPIVSVGHASRTQEGEAGWGTSLAAPVVAGVIALLQERFKRDHNGRLPSCDELERCLLEGGKRIVDVAAGRDNVEHTGAEFVLVDALGAMEKMMAGPPLTS